MKKLMIAAVAMAGLTAMAGTGITSQNIVGYQQQTMTTVDGYNFIIPTFVDVNAGTATYDLQNIQLVNAAGDGMTDNIVGYDTDACLTAIDYYWATVEDSFVPIEKDGWYNGVMSDELVTDVSLPLGTGLYLYLGTEGAQAQYAGQVYGDAFTSMPLSSGYNMVGNATPAPLDLQQVKLVDAAGDGLTDNVVGYDKDACLTEEDFYWATVADSFTTIEQDGWYNGVMSDELVNGYTLQPGQGFFLYVGSEGAKIQLPSPVAK